MAPSGLAILIGAGPITGAGIARILSSPSLGNMAVALLSRTGDANLAHDISRTCHGGPGILKAFKSDTSEHRLNATFGAIKEWKADLDKTYSIDLKLKLSIFNIKHSYKTPFEEETSARFTESMIVYAAGAMKFSQLSLEWMMGQYADDNNNHNNEKQLTKRGTLIFTSTLGSLRTNPGFAAYGAARASVRMLAQSLAREYSPRGIQVVHAIANGGVTDKFDAYEGLQQDQGDVTVKKGQGEDAEKIRKGERIKAESVGRLYLILMEQDVDLWVHELDMRPAAEKF